MISRDGGNPAYSPAGYISMGVLRRLLRPPDNNFFYFFLFLNQNICSGYSKEPSQ